MVCRPNSRSLAVSQGKGLDLASAEASGLMESVESYHAERITSPLKFASQDELRFTHALADVSALPRSSLGAFHTRLRLMWIEGHDLLRDLPVWVPFELVHTNYTLPFPPGSGAFLPSSNGLASGNHRLEAISHGLCEVVERDATTLWLKLDAEGRRRTRVALETVDDAACRQVLERYERAGIDVGVWEMTSDVGIPAFVCAIVDRTQESPRPSCATSGMGCHPARGVALSRALTEAAQSRLTLIAGSRDDMDLGLYQSAREAEWPRRLRGWMGEEGPGRSFRDVPEGAGASLDEDVAWELERLRAVGITEVVVVDLTRPEFQIPVVRVVVPGLEALSTLPGYVPGARARGGRSA
jgi:ribosomal protein S12 methylthiotransferase accessory factor